MALNGLSPVSGSRSLSRTPITSSNTSSYSRPGSTHPSGSLPFRLMVRAWAEAEL